jgi:putative salt-induced outer membrane protein YdiY
MIPIVRHITAKSTCHRAAAHAFVLVLLLGMATSTSAQIVNTLSGFSEAPGWTGSAEASLAKSGGNTDVLTVGTAGKVQWQGPVRSQDAWRHRVRLLGGASRTDVNGNAVVDSSMAHARHLYRLRQWVSSVTFTQVQRDRFQRLRSRVLVGAGLQLDPVQRSTWSLSLGATHMVEREEIRDAAEAQHAQRLSTYLYWHGDLTEDKTVGVNVTGFYQPRWSDWGDVRATGAGELNVRLGPVVTLGLVASLQSNSRPPTGVETTDWNYLTKLIFNFPGR